MKATVLRKINVFVIFVVIPFLLTTSCRTPRDLSSASIRPLATRKLLKKVEQNAFDYKSFTIKRINCRFSTSQSNTNFRSRLKALKDEKILVSISKLNIPVGRVLLTPDSVKYVNYIDRNYFVDDYTYLSDFLKIDLDFEAVQSIISNNAFSYRNDLHNKDFRTFQTTVDEGMYLLQSEKDRKMEKLEEEGNENKVERRLKRLNEEALIFQKMYFNPVNFALSKLIVRDLSNDRNLEMVFSDFEQVKNHDYPGAIEIAVNSKDENIHLKIRMNGFSTKKIDSISLRIPEKYEQINVN